MPGSEVLADFCVIEQAGETALRYPKVTFDIACGVGCTRADVLQGFGTFTDRPALSTMRDADGRGIGYLSVSHLPRERLFKPLRRLVRLSDGVTPGAIRTTPVDGAQANCTAGVFDESATLGVVSALDEPTARGSRGFGLFRPGGALWHWPESWRTLDPADRGCYAFDAEGALALFQYCDTVYVEDRGAGAARVDLQQRGVRIGAGENDLGVWTLTSSGVTSRLMGWTRASGVVQLSTEIPGDSCAVGVSPTTIAGFVGQPGTAGACPGLWQGPRAFWLERRPGPAAGEVHVSPVLGPVPLIPQKVVTWGDFVAVGVVTEPDETYWQGRQHVWLWRRSDGLLRRIEAREGHVIWQRGITLTEDYLYVAEVPADANDRYLRELTRYELSHAEELGLPP